MAIWTKAAWAAGGIVATLVAQAASKSKTVRNACVNVTAGVMKANDAVQACTQGIMDDAEDIRAEADRERRINAAVAERLEELEAGIREEVTKEVDGE